MVTLFTSTARMITLVAYHMDHQILSRDIPTSRVVYSSEQLWALRHTETYIKKTLGKCCLDITFAIQNQTLTQLSIRILLLSLMKHVLHLQCLIMLAQEGTHILYLRISSHMEI